MKKTNFNKENFNLYKFFFKVSILGFLVSVLIIPFAYFSIEFILYYDLNNMNQLPSFLILTIVTIMLGLFLVYLEIIFISKYMKMKNELEQIINKFFVFSIPFFTGISFLFIIIFIIKSFFKTIKSKNNSDEETNI